MAWDWGFVWQTVGAAAAIVTVLGALTQVFRPASAFSNYERWSKVRADALTDMERDQAEGMRRAYLVEYVAASETRVNRLLTVFGALLAIALLVGFMIYVRTEWPSGFPHPAWWLSLFGAIALVVTIFVSPRQQLARARSRALEALGYDSEDHSGNGRVDDEQPAP